MEIVLNKCFGGFSLSAKAIKKYLELEGKECYFYEQSKYSFRDKKDEYSITNEKSNAIFLECSTKYLGEKVDIIPKEYSFYHRDIERTDTNLIKVVKELGSEANGSYANLEIVDIPNNVNWEMHDYDGIETVHEVHRSW